MSPVLSPQAMEAFSQAVLALNGQTVSCVGIRLEADPDAYCQAVEAFVSETERQRAARFVHEIDAARHLLGRFVVRSVLTRALGGDWTAEEFQTGCQGKPILVGSGIDFSISHSGPWVWAAFCREAAVGIDVEEVRRLEDLDDLVGVLHPHESASILAQAEDAHETFFRCWTRKEALLKASGEGLLREPGSFRVRTDACPGDWLVEAWNGSIDEWTTFDFHLPDEPPCHVAVAAQAPGLRLASFLMSPFPCLAGAKPALP